MIPSAEIIEQAKLYPNGWVYEIDGDVDQSKHIPPEKIRGAWKVNEKGEITGEYILNKNHKAWNELR